ncbi:hypothetical protein RN001_014727 [Aquatica leii]|uniref:Uncharacterized protein n=1 Tax=Aquatica leii TaxID=1421715 RepID=A0AAN7SKQ3_9COLE|nr:hypothetical protein RN001_014727 [Aquatica leii]
MEDDPTEQNELLVNQVPQQTPGSSTDNQQPCCSYNFEDILLQTIKQSKSVQPKQPRKKIAAGAEVITANVAKQRETEAKKLLTEKGKNKTARNKICKKKSDTESDSDESESEPSYADTDDDMDDEEFSNEEEMCSVQSIDEDKENEDKG